MAIFLPTAGLLAALKPVENVEVEQCFLVGISKTNNLILWLFGASYRNSKRYLVLYIPSFNNEWG